MGDKNTKGQETENREGDLQVGTSDGLNALRTDFAKNAIRDAKARIDARILIYENGNGALTKEQYEDYKHDAYLFFEKWGI